MKKISSILLILALLLSFAAPAIASEGASAQTLNWTDGFGFHCNTNGGNGQTDIVGYAEIYDGVNNDNLPITLERVGNTTAWNLLTNNIVCQTCGRNDWVTYSNNINGKNIQVNHPVLADDLKTLPKQPTQQGIYKTVNGVNIADWAQENGIDMANLMKDNSMSFDAYQNGEHVSVGKLNHCGLITFTPALTSGEFRIVETITGTSADIFATDAAQNITVNSNGELVSISTVHRYVSDANHGVLVSAKADENGQQWNLPDVWNNALSDQPAFKKLMDMDAQWIWGAENTYVYGITGSVWGTEMTVYTDTAETVPIYFAADNVAAIYVNGQLAAWTTIAFEGRDIAQTLPEADNPTEAAALVFKKLSHSGFDGRWDEGWTHAYESHINLTPGENTITIIAANSAQADYGDNVNYNSTNNPCGLIFGFELTCTTFNNRIGNWSAPAELGEDETVVAPKNGNGRGGNSRGSNGSSDNSSVGNGSDDNSSVGNSSSGNSSGGSRTGNAIVVDNRPAVSHLSHLSEQVEEPDMPYEEPITSQEDGGAITVIILFMSGIAAFIYRRNDETKG